MKAFPFTTQGLCVEQDQKYFPNRISLIILGISCPVLQIITLASSCTNELSITLYTDRDVAVQHQQNIKGADCELLTRLQGLKWLGSGQ